MLRTFPEVESASASSAALVIGVGNCDRGDDGIGPLVARRLCHRSAVRVLCRGGDALGLIEDWAGAEAVILIDAAAGVTGPGTVHRLQLSGDGGGREALAGAPSLSSTHALSVATAIDLARELNLLPRQLIIYAVEGRRFTPGAIMSAEVLAAADSLVDQIAAEVERLVMELQPRG